MSLTTAYVPYNSDLYWQYENQIDHWPAYNNIEIASPLYSRVKTVQENLEQCYFILQHNTVVGKFCIYINPKMKWKQQDTVSFGSFECVNDQAVAAFLFRELKKKASKFNRPVLVGPIEGSTWQSYRVVSTNHQPYLFDVKQPIYYRELVENNGFKMVANYHSKIDYDLNIDQDWFNCYNNKFNSMGIKIRPISQVNFEKDLKSIHELSHLAFANNLLFTPISLSTFLGKYLAIKNLIKPEFTLMAFNKMNQLIGYSFAMPNLLSKTNSLVLKTLARHPDVKYTGLGRYLGLKTVLNAKTYGIENVIHAFMIDENPSVRLSEKNTQNIYANYQLFYTKL